jgi:hypothetical protein
MRRVGRLFLAFLMCSAGGLLAGDIQVICEQGPRLYLDGAFVGTSTPMEGGLAPTDVPDGRHTIRVEKRKYLPLTVRVTVAGDPIEVPVSGFEPEPAVGPEREGPAAGVSDATGGLRITSVPQNCTVTVDGTLVTKSTPFLDLGGHAPGGHVLAFSREGYRPISAEVNLPPCSETAVRGDLKSGKAEVVHRRTGSLRVISGLERCTVRLPGMTRETSRSKLNISHLPPGEHRMVISWIGIERSTNVLITTGHRTTVTVSFLKEDELFTFSTEPE